MTGSAYALTVLFLINLMNFFDRQIIGGVGEGIRREMGLSDTALGLLGTVFTLLYAVVGLPLGRLSDKKERRKILAAGVFLWSLLTAVSGLARSFAQLIVARLGVGVDDALPERFRNENHGISGNPARFDRGGIRLDEAWRTGLRSSTKQAVRAASFLLARQYGFPW